MTPPVEEIAAIEQGSGALSLTVGPTPDGRKVAIISTGGHPQIPESGTCHVLTLEIVSGWGKRKIDGWFERMKAERPWETRQ